MTKIYKAAKDFAYETCMRNRWPLKDVKAFWWSLAPEASNDDEAQRGLRDGRRLGLDEAWAIAWNTRLERLRSEGRGRESDGMD